MKLTKYEHACFTVEHEGKVIVVDPGSFSTDFIAPSDVVAVIITHTHPDHFDAEQLASIIDKNPDAIVLAHSEVTAQIEAFQTKAVSAGETAEVADFRLTFFGGQHAIIHPSIPPIANLGVLINDLLYYPGDSFKVPDSSVDTLAIPASAPWMKMSEAMDFLAAVKPRFAFPTHDAILSDNGKGIADRLLGKVANEQGTTYQRLTDIIEI